MHASETALLDALNRLGGRQSALATTRDLIAAAPRDLPLVAVRADGAGSGAAPAGGPPAAGSPAVTAFNVEAFMARTAELEPEALAALHRLVATGVLPAAEDPGAEPRAAWATADPKGVARQAVQWALDHPELGLHGEAFAIARLALG